jgi:hypothetical protein
MASLAERVKAKARALGFDLVGIAAARPAPHADVLADWLAHSYHGEMAYMARSAEARQDPRRIAADVRSVIVLGTRYVAPRLPAAIRDDPSRGLIAAYAWGPDYHDQIKPRLSELDAFLRRETGRTALARCYVDTGPILERDWAMLAGLGFIGRNTCLIHPSLGSWLFLSVVLAPEELEPDPAPELFFLPPAALRPMPVLADRPGKTAPNGGVIPRSVFCDEESPASVGEPVPCARPQDWLAVRPGIPRSRPPQLVPCAPVPGHRTGCQGRPVRVKERSPDGLYSISATAFSPVARDGITDPLTRHLR